MSFLFVKFSGFIYVSLSHCHLHYLWFPRVFILSTSSIQLVGFRVFIYVLLSHCYLPCLLYPHIFIVTSSFHFAAVCGILLYFATCPCHYIKTACILCYSTCPSYLKHYSLVTSLPVFPLLRS